MSKGWVYKSGDWNLICDSCSKKVKASTSKRRWDGFQVCPSCFEIRHPQDFVKATIDKISVPFSRPQSTDQFVPMTLSIPSISDSISLLEAISKDVTIVPIDSPLYVSSFSDDSLGSFTVGTTLVGGNGSPYGYTNEIILQEQLSLIINKSLDDNLVISETVSLILSYNNNSLGSYSVGNYTLG